MRRVGVLVLVLVWGLSASAWAAAGRAGAKAAARPQGGLSALLSGRGIPLSMKLKSLNSSWRCFAAVGMDTQSSAFAAVYGVQAGVYYTQGRTISAQGETYLVAYGLRSGGPGTGIAMLMGRGGTPAPKLTGDTPVHLALLDLRTMGSFSDIRRFNLKEELASFNGAYTALQTAMTSQAASPGGDQTESDASLSNLKGLTMAAEMYMTDYDAAPAMDTPEAFRTALDEYVPNADSFEDPDTGDFYLANASLSKRSTAGIKNPAETVVLYQAKPGKDGLRGVGFMDGNVKKVTEAEWKKLSAGSGIPPS